MKIEISAEAGVLVNQYDLEILYACAKKIVATPGQTIELVNSGSEVKNRYLMMTLIHFGVSCGQIKLV